LEGQKTEGGRNFLAGLPGAKKIEKAQFCLLAVSKKAK